MVTNTLMGVRRLMRDLAACGLRGGVLDAGDSPVGIATDVSLSTLIFAGWVCSSRGIGTVLSSESQSIVLTSSMSFVAIEDLLIGVSPAIGSCPFSRLSMLPTEGGAVLIGGGGSGGGFAVGRLAMVGSEDIKLVCNGENGRHTETQSGISILRIVCK